MTENITLRGYSTEEIKGIENSVREMEKDINIDEIPTITPQMIEETQKRINERRKVKIK